MSESINNNNNHHDSRTNGSSITNGNSQHTGDQSRHDFFVVALESLGKDLPETEWIDKLQESLKWDRRQVELHAYRYFCELAALDREDRTKSASAASSSEHSPSIVSMGSLESSTSGWSKEELILFDVIIAVQGSQYVRGTKSERWAWVASVAAQFPGRSHSEIIQRVSQLLQVTAPASAVEDTKGDGEQSDVDGQQIVS